MSSLPSAGQPRYRKKSIFIGLTVTAIVVALGASYGFSYQSVRGLTIEIVEVHRTYTPGTFSSIQFDITAHVWSTNSLDTRTDSVQFFLSVDSIPFSAVSARESTFSPYSFLRYTLRFVNNNAQDATLLGERTSHRIALSMGTFVSAGIYSASLSPSTSRTIAISRVVDRTISSTVLDDCQRVENDVVMSQRGGVTIRLSSSPDFVRVAITDSSDDFIFNESSLNLDRTMRLPADTYSILVENPGFLCGGADINVAGAIEFWHEEAILQK